MAAPRVLIVEDNEEVRELLKVILSSKGFDVADVDQGRKAVDFCEDMPPDIVVLDLTLPDIDGLEVCRKIRSFSRMEGVPIIICSARAHVSERVKGLETGADDYLTKPFDPSELVTRIQVLLRRSGHPVRETRKSIQSGELKLDPRSYLAVLSGRTLSELSPREFDILYLLVDRSPDVVNRIDVSKVVLGREYDGDSRVIDMHVAQIRKKLGPTHSRKILTIPGKGYLWSK